jgi:hypothetical protein
MEFLKIVARARATTSHATPQRTPRPDSRAVRALSTDPRATAAREIS